MAITSNKLWIHASWSTMDQKPLIPKEHESEIFKIIVNQYSAMKCQLLSINGTKDQLHVLFQLNPQRAISEVLKYVKGGSSHEINQNKILEGRFAWEKGYTCYSVSESDIGSVKKFIKVLKNYDGKKAKLRLENQDIFRIHGLKKNYDL
jgi:putative transposase